MRWNDSVLRNEHAALRVGETVAVQTGHPAVFSMLRASKDEVVLIVVNLSKDATSDYSLSVAKSPMAVGEYRVVPMIGESEPASLTVNASGGVAGYKPLPGLPPVSALILQLQK